MLPGSHPAREPGDQARGTLKDLGNEEIKHLQSSSFAPEHNTLPSASRACQGCSAIISPLFVSLPSSLLQHICLPSSILHSHCFSPACFVQGTKSQFSSLHRCLQHPLNTRDQRSLTPWDAYPPEPRARLISQTFILLCWLKHLNSVVQLEVKMCLRESSRL